MTDKELLELAAKAAGIRAWWQEGSMTDSMYCGDGKWFNPITDDGDALRLAVKLGFPHMIGTWMGCYLEEGEYEQDPYAATRRAIVRAAAELGKGM